MRWMRYVMGRERRGEGNEEENTLGQRKNTDAVSIVYSDFTPLPRKPDDEGFPPSARRRRLSSACLTAKASPSSSRRSILARLQGIAQHPAVQLGPEVEVGDAAERDEPYGLLDDEEFELWLKIPVPKPS